MITAQIEETHLNGCALGHFFSGFFFLRKSCGAAHNSRFVIPILCCGCLLVPQFSSTPFGTLALFRRPNLPLPFCLLSQPLFPSACTQLGTLWPTLKGDQGSKGISKVSQCETNDCYIRMGRTGKRDHQFKTSDTPSDT